MLSAESCLIVDVAYREAARRRRRFVSASHLAFALLVSPDDTAQRALRAVGVGARETKEMEGALRL